MAKLVLTYARKVLSDARWSLATLPEFSSVRLGETILVRTFHDGSFCWDGDWISEGGVVSPETVVGRVSELLRVGVSIITSSIGEGGGAGACRDKGGGLKDDARFPPRSQLILYRPNLERRDGSSAAGRRGEVSVGE
jgi:hypothetical protein